MKHLHIIAAILGLASHAAAQITLSCDYTSAGARGTPMHYHWNVSNRISPMRSLKMPMGENPRINIVRPLGGKSKNGEMLIEEDTYKWDGQKYVYDWEPLHQQITVVRKRAVLHQLMIDNPPWAFQRGLNLKVEDAVETYGNAWPPNDPTAWSQYIRDMLKELVSTYGKETAEQWRYCIGREIGTKGHWRGTMLEFFEHYRITERAIHSILPKAKVGTHFLWASSENSFGPDFVKWARKNKARYDFIGVSFYPFYNRTNRVDLQHVYKPAFKGNMVNAVFAHDESQKQYNIMVANYSADPKSDKAESIQIKTMLPVQAGSSMKYRTATYQDGRLDGSEWKTAKTTAHAGRNSSELILGTKLKPFSFQKIEIR